MGVAAGGSCVAWELLCVSIVVNGCHSVLGVGVRGGCSLRGFLCVGVSVKECVKERV